MRLSVSARASNLSRAQVEEIAQALPSTIVLDPVWVETTGDKDQITSLRNLDKTDFFTKEIDQMLLEGACRIAVHSAKDLPDPLPEGLCLAALTQGVDAADVLVFRQGESLSALPLLSRIGVSSSRREEKVRHLRSDLICVDIRGNIEQRLQSLDQGRVEGLVMAEAALIRLKLTDRSRLRLDGEGAPLQGQLAVMVRRGDKEMIDLFRTLDTRK